MIAAALCLTSCQQEEPTFDEALLIGKWQEVGTQVFYTYASDYTGKTWDEADDVTEAEAQPRTATEVAATAVDYDLTIRELQAMWEDAARQAVALCGALGALYGLEGCEPGAAALSIDWGDGVLYDRARVWAEQRDLVDAGLLRPERALAWYYGLPQQTEADLQRIRQQYMPKGEKP